MFTSKMLTLGLLLSCPFAFSQIQMDATIELNCPYTDAKQEISLTGVILDDSTRTVIVANDTLSIEAETKEQEKTALVEFFIAVKNSEGEFINVANPALIVEYGTQASVELSETSATGETSDTLKVTAVCTKVS